jgi:hypothetical protein
MPAAAELNILHPEDPAAEFKGYLQVVGRDDKMIQAFDQNSHGSSAHTAGPAA